MNYPDITCPNCDRIMVCNITELLGDKFRHWKCSFCNIKFKLVADSYIKHCEEIKYGKQKSWYG